MLFDVIFYALQNTFTTMNPSTSTAMNSLTPVTTCLCSDTLTPDQRRVLLFNVDQPFEVSIEDFDQKWWPLVTNVWIRYNNYNHVNGDSWKVFSCHFSKHNESSTRKEGIPSEKRRKTKVQPADLCFAKIKVSRFVTKQKVQVERFNNFPDHLHTLEDSEKLKRSEIVRVLVEQEALKNYRPPAIVSAVKEYASENLDLGASIKELRRIEVTNIKYKVRGSLDAHLISDPQKATDIQASMSFLQKQGYQVERYKVSHQSSNGIVFVHPNQLGKLERYGWLTLIDSTHKTNRYDWHLFTLYVRDTFGC